MAEPVNRGEGKIRRRPALPADPFRAAPHVVHHPRRQQRVIRIAPDFADVKRQRRHEVAHVLDARFDEQIGIGHLPPKFRFDDMALETGGQRFKRIQNQKMRADVRRVPVVFVRNKNRARLLFRQDFGDDFHRRPPRRAIFPARNRIDILPIRHRQTEAEEIARAPQFTQPLRAPRDFAAQRHGNVDDVPLRLTQQPQRQSADDALVVRMRRENQCFRRVDPAPSDAAGIFADDPAATFFRFGKAARVPKQIFKRVHDSTGNAQKNKPEKQKDPLTRLRDTSSLRRRPVRGREGAFISHSIRFIRDSSILL